MIRSNTASPVGGGGADSGGVNSPVDEVERERLKEKQRQEREKVPIIIKIFIILLFYIILYILDEATD